MKIFYLVLILTTLSACNNSEDWVCRSGVNANGDAIQYSENIKTGETGAYEKCKD